MSARGFGAVLSAGAVAGAALGFYLISLRVASERAQLEEVESSIAMTQRDIRLLQTELGTRGRLAQLERWNVKFIRLAAPSADQFVNGGFQLATLAKPDSRPAIGAPVVLASAPVDSRHAPSRLGGDADPDTARPVAPSRPVSEMIHVAGYSTSTPQQATPAPKSGQAAATVRDDSGKPRKAAAATKPVKSATADPLAPLSSSRTAAKAASPAATRGTATSRPNSKDAGSD